MILGASFAVRLLIFIFVVVVFLWFLTWLVICEAGRAGGPKERIDYILENPAVFLYRTLARVSRVTWSLLLVVGLRFGTWLRRVAVEGGHLTLLRVRLRVLVWIARKVYTRQEEVREAEVQAWQGRSRPASSPSTTGWAGRTRAGYPSQRRAGR